MESEKSSSMPNELRAQIAKRAHELWEAGGRVHGHDLADWFKAENEICSNPESCSPATEMGLANTVRFRQLVDAEGGEFNSGSVLQEASVGNASPTQELKRMN